MPDQLPRGWVKTTLGELCSPVATVQPAATPNAEFTYFDIGGIMYSACDTIQRLVKGSWSPRAFRRVRIVVEDWVRFL
jgi:hypothetical protein